MLFNSPLKVGCSEKSATYLNLFILGVLYVFGHSVPLVGHNSISLVRIVDLLYCIKKLRAFGGLASQWCLALFGYL